MKKIEINNETFELIVPRKEVSTNISSATLFDKYDRPSATKIEIYNEWMAWGRDIDVRLGVSGAGSHTFSLEGFYDNGEHIYKLVITKGHNRAYQIA